MFAGILKSWRDWSFVCVLALICAVLSVLQYRWTGEVRDAERDRMRATLQISLRQFGRAFDGEISQAIAAALPAAAERRAIQSPLFSRVFVAIPSASGVGLNRIDGGGLQSTPWPRDWEPLGSQLWRRYSGERFVPPGEFGQPVNVIEIPVFGDDGREAEWIILEIDLQRLRSDLLPELERRFINPGGSAEYDVAIRDTRNSSTLLYTSGGAPSSGAPADSEAQFFAARQTRGPQHGGPGWRRDFSRKPGRPFDEPGRWTVSVRHRSGSLNAAAGAARWRNFALQLLLLGLILATAIALLQYTARARRLADMQFRFIAGISHEIRTPLTVIRGAGHNLSTGVVREATQVQSYARLIVQHSEHLTEIIEQILAFASAREKAVPSKREEIALGPVLEQAIDSGAADIEASGCRLDREIPTGLPPVLGDPVALRRVFQNLLSNAAKHGGDGKWIGISAEMAGAATAPLLRITVSDRGPGIPASELAHIFDPFFRGERALLDRVRGTGLGLGLIKEIVEAHSGKITVSNAPAGGARFTVELPALPMEHYDEFAHSTR